MRLLPRVCLLMTLAGIASAYVQPADAFVIQSIQVEGLHGLSRETVLNYLPVHVGDQYDPSQSSNVINSLYASGLFGNISIGQQGNTLIIRIEERPIISIVEVKGNKCIPTDKINEVLKSIGLAQGHVFDNAVLEHIVHSLKSQYDTLGKYNATVVPVVVEQPRNRVAIRINISEGQTLRIKDITIIGNTAFSSRKLIHQMCLTTFRPWAFFTHSDQFAQDKLDQSLESIRAFYLDRGYLHFTIDSSQATLTPDRKYVYLVIHVTEGCQYHVKGYQLAGNLIVPPQQIQKVVMLHPGMPFSRQAVRDTNNNISRVLGNMGYLFASVNVTPDIDEVNKSVYLTFYVVPGNRIYVRRINFSGNTKTEDVVLRRELRQFEGGLASSDAIAESERQLNLSGYMESVHTDTTPVPGVPDQVDLNYTLVESPSASATAGLGYGTQGYIVNAGLNQANFLGTGNVLGLNFSNSLYSTAYSVSYVNPYYTDDGVARGITLFTQRTTPGKVNIASYTTNVYGGNVNYSIPVTSHGDTLQLGYGYQNLGLTLGNTPSLQLLNFTNTYGTNFNQILLSAGWSRNTADRAIFPTCGMIQSLSFQLALPGSSRSVEYYKANYLMYYYHPIISKFIFTARGSLGYGAGIGGTKGLPFFANYYAGGIGSTGEVRGFDINTLGPHDTPTINSQGYLVGGGNPLGGNELITGSLGIIFPNLISEDKLRTTAFFDAGNVYSTKCVAIGGTASGPIRYSTGLAVDWRVPVMNVLLEVALAKVLNAQPGDNTRVFDFSVGTNF